LQNVDSEISVLLADAHGRLDAQHLSYSPRYLAIISFFAKYTHVSVESAASDEHAAVLALLPDLEEVRRLHGGARLGVRHKLHADHQPLAAHVAHDVWVRVAQLRQPLQQVRAHRQAVRLRLLFLNDLE
jgi:hydroxyacyl-ACP dehydratase HTD2-like protein with hotdog domain